MRDHANNNSTVSDRATTDAATIARTAADTGPSTADQLDEALACLRKYGRQSAVDVSELETRIRRVRNRIASPAPEPVDA